MGRLNLRLLLGLLAVLLVAPAQAEQSVREGEFVVHYSAVNTTSLPTDILRGFGIVPAPKRRLLVVNVQNGNAQVAASASGTARNLMQQSQKLDLRAAPQASMLDLLATFEASEGEVLIFELSVQPQGAPRPIAIRFQQQFYND